LERELAFPEATPTSPAGWGCWSDLRNRYIRLYALMADVGVLKTRVFASMAKVFALPKTTGAGPAAREQPIVA
jgi:hypothetical protein